MEATFQRARQPAQKQQRRDHLLATARNLLASGTELRTLSLSELARRAGLAKASVYTYFASREALLLALLWDEWAHWFVELQRAWPEAGPVATAPTGLTQTVEAVADALAREALLCELTAALPTVLEQNLSEAAIADFKRASLAFFGEIGGFLAGCCPELPAATYAELARDAAHAIVGLYPSTHPSPAAARALSNPDLGFFRRDFARELRRFLAALAADYQRRSAVAD
jgi:AcrR family transcriptional regulator